MKKILCIALILVMVAAFIPLFSLADDPPDEETPTDQTPPEETPPIDEPPEQIVQNIGFQAVTINNNSVTFRWDAVSGAVYWNYDTRQPGRRGYRDTRYYIERAHSLNGEYFELGYTDTTLTFADNSTSLVPGNTYYYRISFMVGTTVYYSNTLTVTLQSVSVSNFRAATITNNSVMLRWDAVPNVVGWDYNSRQYSGGFRYHVERSEARDGIFFSIGGTYDNLTYTDSSGSLVAGNTYYYRLSVMVNRTIFSSDVIEVTLLPVSLSGFHVAATGTNSVTFRWDTVSGAVIWNYDTRQPGHRNYRNTRYYIDRADSLNGEYFELGFTDTNLTFTVNNVNPETTYYYRLSCMVNTTIFTSDVIALRIAPNLDSASDWAWEGINEAYNSGFIPEELLGNFNYVINRQEFCRMAVRWVEFATKKSIDAVLAEKGLTRNTNAFTDTSDPDILAAYALGITDGIGDNLFAPLGQFTREQAATMIMRTCRAIGANVSNSPDSGFADANIISDWALDGINFVRANGIMQGTGGNNFSPKGTYTIQESIITFNNIQPEELPGR